MGSNVFGSLEMERCRRNPVRYTVILQIHGWCMNPVVIDSHKKKALVKDGMTLEASIQNSLHLDHEVYSKFR